jgi:hypothetical protein
MSDMETFRQIPPRMEVQVLGRGVRRPRLQRWKTTKRHAVKMKRTHALGVFRRLRWGQTLDDGSEPHVGEVAVGVQMDPLHPRHRHIGDKREEEEEVRPHEYLWDKEKGIWAKRIYM